MTGLKIFLACALGAFIGTLVALSLSFTFWWVGLIAGGIMGYLSFEFTKVLKAIKTAWNDVYGRVSDSQKWRIFGILFLFWWSVFTSLFSLFLLFLAPIISLVYAYIFFLSIGAGGSSFAIFLTKEEISEKDFIFVKKAAFWCSPVGIIICVSRLLFILFSKLKNVKRKQKIKNVCAGVCAGLSSVIKTFFLFFKKIFVLIHSDARVICAFDAAIGTGIGYFSGNALIGALSGGVLGVLNYYVVSIKILKLVPQK